MTHTMKKHMLALAKLAKHFNLITSNKGNARHRKNHYFTIATAALLTMSTVFFNSAWASNLDRLENRYTINSSLWYGADDPAIEDAIYRWVPTYKYHQDSCRPGTMVTNLETAGTMDLNSGQHHTTNLAHCKNHNWNSNESNLYVNYRQYGNYLLLIYGTYFEADAKPWGHRHDVELVGMVLSKASGHGNGAWTSNGAFLKGAVSQHGKWEDPESFSNINTQSIGGVDVPMVRTELSGGVLGFGDTWAFEWGDNSGTYTRPAKESIVIMNRMFSSEANKLDSAMAAGIGIYDWGTADCGMCVHRVGEQYENLLAKTYYSYIDDFYPKEKMSYWNTEVSDRASIENRYVEPDPKMEADQCSSCLQGKILKTIYLYEAAFSGVTKKVKGIKQVFENGRTVNMGDTSGSAVDFYTFYNPGGGLVDYVTQVEFAHNFEHIQGIKITTKCGQTIQAGETTYDNNDTQVASFSRGFSATFTELNNTYSLTTLGGYGIDYNFYDCP